MRNYRKLKFTYEYELLPNGTPCVTLIISNKLLHTTGSWLATSNFFVVKDDYKQNANIKFLNIFGILRD